MSSAAGAPSWLRGRVKAVPSGDSLVIIGNATRAVGPPEKTITLSSLIAPRLARRDGVDEPFAWESREFLRKLCIGKEVIFKVDYTVPTIGREFGSVFLGDANVAKLVVAKGWAKVRDQGQQKGEASPFLADLKLLEEQAQQNKLGRWSTETEGSIRNLPPSAIGDSGTFDAVAFLEANKGKPMEAIVEQVRDGSTVRAYLLPEFQFVQVLVAGIKAPLMNKKVSPETAVVIEKALDESNGEASAEPHAPVTSAQRLAASAASTEYVEEAFAREAKHFTEMRVLNRDVRIVLEGVDKFRNLIGSVYYPDGESAKDLAMQLIENGLASYVEWSASMMEDDAKKRLKTAELEAKKKMIRMWFNYTRPKTDSTAIHNQNFTGKVVEVVSGDCIIVADDSIPFGSPSAERRVNLSSIRCPKMGNPRKEDMKPQAYAREAKEFLRSRIIGRQVNVSMEYSRQVSLDQNGGNGGPVKLMDFGSVFLASLDKLGADTLSAPATGSNPLGGNIAELLVARGFATVVRHKDFEERSNNYDALLAAESRAMAGKKGQHSGKEPAPLHINDLTTAPAKKCKEHLAPFLRERKIPAVVEYVLSGHRFKLLVPSQTCSIAFSLSGVRCPGRGELYSEEAIALMRRKIMQRDVEIDVETVDRVGTFLGSLWESKTNVAVALLEAGLARLQLSFGSDNLPDIYLLKQAELSAKKKKLKIWENFVEGDEVSNGAPTDKKQQKEELKVTVTEVIGGGKFYVQSVADQRVDSIQKQLASLSILEAPVIGAFCPKRGEIVLAQFSADNSWNRAMIVNGPGDKISSEKDTYEVFYIDYGNQETVTYSQIRPINPSMSSAPGLAQLCSLAYIKVPSLEEDYGQEAAFYLSELTLNGPKEFKAVIEEKDTSGGKVKGQGTGTVFAVTLIETSDDSSVNAAMLKEGLARIEKKRGWQPRDAKAAIEELEKQQEEAKKKRLGMWEYGDIQSDDEDNGPPARKAAGKR